MDASMNWLARSAGRTAHLSGAVHGHPHQTQLDNIKTQLDLVLLALEALTGIGSEAILASRS